MGDAADFDAVTAHLNDRFHCVRIDLPGHGAAALRREKIPADAGLSLATLAKAFRAQVLDPLVQNKLARPTLVGYSMGGRLALQTALDYPEAVGKLVLVSTSPGITDQQARKRRRAKDRVRAASILSDFDGFLDTWYQLPIFGDLSQTPGYAAMLHRRLRNRPEALARIIVELSPGRQPSNWHRLDALQNTTWIVGADDPKYRTLGQRLQDDGYQVVIQPNAAHALHVEHPEWLARKIAELVGCRL
jgi:2-succinyl-6-hydroxy-2,4-cyclohexadiene-1-carboxylate synthase